VEKRITLRVNGNIPERSKKANRINNK